MLKDTGYQEKIEMLLPWFEEIIDIVKKDLRNEHLKMDRSFCKKYFLGKHPSHVQVPEMVEAYRLDIAQGNVGLGEFIATRWILKHTDIYAFFEEKLKEIYTDFEALEELPLDLSHALVQSATTSFGAKNTYLFAVFNSVVFPATVYTDLKERALQESAARKQKEEEREAAVSLESEKQKYTRELAALTDRYEKKLGGMQRKYLQDTSLLKKQVGSLQKKLGAADGG